MKDYNLLNLINRIAAKLNDQEFNRDQIKQFINDAYFEVIGEDKYPFMERVDTDMAGGSDFLMLPSDYQSTLAVTATRKDGTRSPLRYISPREYLELDKFNRPTFVYTIAGNELMVNVPVGQATATPEGTFYINNIAVKHYYLARPHPLEKDSDVPKIPYEFSEIIVLGALSRAEQRRDNFDFAHIYNNQQQQLIENMKIRYGQRQQSFGSRATLPYRRIRG